MFIDLKKKVNTKLEFKYSASESQEFGKYMSDQMGVSVVPLSYMQSLIYLKIT